MQKLHFSIKINAPVQKVWDTMLQDETYRQWTEPFGSGGSYDGSWEKGSDIRFLAAGPDGTMSGMISRIAENKPLEFISIEHVGVMINGVETREGDWIGAMENYTFKEENGLTEVLVDIDVEESLVEDFSEMWPKGLQKLKEIAEK